MPRVLYLAYHFPPMGGGGVQRNGKMVRYLPEMGWDPVVVTGSGGTSDRWSPSDDTLLGDVPDGVEVHRLTGQAPPLGSRSRAALERRLMIPSPTARWWTSGALALGQEVGAGVDLIYASLVPYETATTAVELSRRLAIPWVADLQDPWALDEMWTYPSRLHQAQDTNRMRKLLNTAAAIVMNTAEAKARLISHFPELAGRIVVSIPNGFDQNDFAGPPPPPRDDGRFRIVHAGALHTDQGLRLRRTRLARRLLGGTYAPVDVLTRSHVHLLAAIEMLAERKPEVRAEIEVVLAGRSVPIDRETAERHAYVTMPGYLTHTETVSLLRGADLLFLPMHDLEPPLRAGLVPGKTYEYLASRRPILAAVPDGDARDLLEEAGNASLCRPADVAGMAAAIAAALARHHAGEPAPEPADKVLVRYERRRQAEDLSDVLGRVLEADADGAPSVVQSAAVSASG